MSTTSMSRSEREAFLAETRVGIFSVTEAGRGPLTIPIWFEYTPGATVRFVTGGASRKATLLAAAGRASLCVQTEAAPYKYVSVEGPAAVVGAPDFERDVRAIAIRYLGPQVGEMYLAMTAEQHVGAVLVELTPDHWLTVDYAKAGY